MKTFIDERLGCLAINLLTLARPAQPLHVENDGNSTPRCGWDGLCRYMSWAGTDSVLDTRFGLPL